MGGEGREKSLRLSPDASRKEGKRNHSPHDSVGQGPNIAANGAGFSIRSRKRREGGGEKRGRKFPVHRIHTEKKEKEGGGSPMLFFMFRGNQLQFRLSTASFVTKRIPVTKGGEKERRKFLLYHSHWGKKKREEKKKRERSEGKKKRGEEKQEAPHVLTIIPRFRSRRPRPRRSNCSFQREKTKKREGEEILCTETPAVAAKKEKKRGKGTPPSIMTLKRKNAPQLRLQLDPVQKRKGKKRERVKPY